MTVTSSFDFWCNFWAWMISFYLLICYYLHYPLWGKTLRLSCDNRKDPCVFLWFWSQHSLQFLLAAQRITSSPGRNCYLQSCHHEFTTEKKVCYSIFIALFLLTEKKNLIQHKLHFTLTKNKKKLPCLFTRSKYTRLCCSDCCEDALFRLHASKPSTFPQINRWMQ